ncbi:MAG: hypothetical protein P4N59_18735 [Negativicutes bacterium]|nr:hypothetical protein [Negativicutes bacterium]
MRKKIMLGLVVVMITGLLTGGCGGNDKDAKPAAAVQPAEQAKQPVAVNLTPASRKELNTFFSNFAEVGLKPFADHQLPQSSLIDFGIMHIVLNNRQVIHNGKLPSAEVDNACVKYFGFKPKAHQSTQSFQYANGVYTVPAASGESIRFAQIESLTDKGNGSFAAVVNVFVASSGFTGNPHGTAADWKASGEVPKLVEKINATITKTNDGTNRWLLNEYVKRQ